MTNNQNISQTNEQRYIEINGEQIAVTEEVYQEYMRPLWAEHKRQEREKRCFGKNGNRCTENCCFCKQQRKGSVLSLEEFNEDGFEVADSVNTENIVMNKILREALHTALNKLEPENRRIAELFAMGFSELEIAAEIGLSQRGINKRKQKIFARLYACLKDFR